MKKIIVVFILLTVFLFHSSTFAQDSNDSFFRKYTFGVGVIAGVPTGLTFKYNVDPDVSIDGGLGWETSGDNEFHIYGTYIHHVYGVLNVPKGKLPLYFGAGLRWMYREHKDNKLGIRIPAGIEYQFQDLPMGAFFELVPVLNLRPDTDFDLEGGIGIRYFF